MARVTEILTGNKISIASNWEWEGNKGNTILIDGYNLENSTAIPKDIAEPFAKQRLISILQNKEVTLHTPAKLEEDGVLRCRVFLEGVDVNRYFPEFTAKS